VGFFEPAFRSNAAAALHYQRFIINASCSITAAIGASLEASVFRGKQAFSL